VVLLRTSAIPWPDFIRPCMTRGPACLTILTILAATSPPRTASTRFSNHPERTFGFAYIRPIPHPHPTNGNLASTPLFRSPTTAPIKSHVLLANLKVTRAIYQELTYCRFSQLVLLISLFAPLSASPSRWKSLHATAF
jgi:hypothetical protein